MTQFLDLRIKSLSDQQSNELCVLVVVLRSPLESLKS